MPGLFEKTMRNGARALARGELVVAASAFELAALDQPESSAEAQAAEFALARTCLDAGDGLRLEHLLRKWTWRSSGAAQLAWLLLEAERRIDQGELSEASALLDAIAGSPTCNADAMAARAEAMQLRAFVLATLNRLGEAEALERALRDVSDEDTTSVTQFVHDRREGVDPWRWTVDGRADPTKSDGHGRARRALAFGRVVV